MKRVNKGMCPQKFATIMQRYARDAARLELNLSDILDEGPMSDLLDEYYEEAEDELVDGVLAEVGLVHLEGFGYVPVEAPETAETVVPPRRHAVAVGVAGEEDAE